MSTPITIFHYQRIEKFYLGSETIEDQRPESGLPADSTDIKPPFEKLTTGMIPVFNGVNWDIVKDTFWKPKHRELNYDAGRKMDSYHPLSLSIYEKIFPNYPSMPMLCNTNLVIQAICQRNRLAHEKFNLTILLHKKLFSTELQRIPIDSPNYGTLTASPTLLYKYKLEMETMVYLMRRILDSLVQLSYLLTNYEEFKKTKTIQHNEIGCFTNKKLATTDIEKIIIGDDADYSSDTTNFLQIINDLFNSFKHCLMHDESYPLISREIPTITSYQAKKNNHNNEIIYHNHNAYHLMMGFQDTVIRILKNQNIYKIKNSDENSIQ